MRSIERPRHRESEVFDGFGATTLVGLSALAEATVRPIMPDAAMMPLAQARPRSWWRRAARTLGSRWLSFEGIDSTYASTVAIARRILEREADRLGCHR